MKQTNIVGTSRKWTIPSGRSCSRKPGLLCCNLSMDGCIPVSVPEALCTGVKYNAHYPKLAWHHEANRMYDNLKKHYYWLHMPTDVQSNFGQCESDRRHRLSNEHQPMLNLFPLVELHEFVSFNIFGTLAQAIEETRFFVLMINRNNKFKRAIPVMKTTATLVATMVLENWITRYCIDDVIFMDNGTKFTSEISQHYVHL